MSERCCRTCEFWDIAGKSREDVSLGENGDCLNSLSDRFTPEAGHVCQQWLADTGGPSAVWAKV